MSSFVRNLVVWVVLGSLMVYVFNNVENSSAREQISYSQFKQEVLSDRVAKVIYKGDQMTIIGDRLDGSKFETTHPIFKRDEVLDNAIEENGIIAVYEKNRTTIIIFTTSCWCLSDNPFVSDIFLFYASDARWNVWKRRSYVIWKK